MRANLDITHGLIMAEAVSMKLAEKIGKAEAHALVEEASKKAAARKRHLKDVLLEDEAVTSKIAARRDREIVRSDELSGRRANFSSTGCSASAKSGK